VIAIVVFGQFALQMSDGTFELATFFIQLKRQFFIIAVIIVPLPFILSFALLQRFNIHRETL
jgi:hypothetical protein